MTIVTLNDRPVAAPAEEGETLESLLDALRSGGQIGRDEVVTTFRVDDRPWQADDMDRLGDVRLADVSEVAIATDDLHGYVRRLLSGARSMLGVLLAAVPRVAEQFRTCEPGAANSALLGLLTGLQHLLAFLSQLRHACDFSGDPLDASGGAFRDISAGLDALQVCQERRDWPALAGVLEGELLPPLRGLDGVLQGIIHDA